MLIVSQNKAGIVNFDNIETLFLLKKRNKETEIIEINARGTYDYFLGEYKTVERAKEVLKSIYSFYSSGKMYFSGDTQVQTKLAEKYIEFKMTPDIYEMPEG